MKYLAIYSDGLGEENEGWEEFETEVLALAFIADRLRLCRESGHVTSTSNYHLFHAKRLRIEAVEVISTVRVVK